MLNKCFFMGRFTRDPELRHTQSGTAVASFTLAVDRDFKDKNTGERQADFFGCVAWRSTAEFVSRFFGKGRMAVVVGSMQMRDWTDKEGNKRRSAELVVESIYFADSKKYSSNAGPDPIDQLAQSAAALGVPGPEQGGFQDYPGDDGPLPF